MRELREIVAQKVTHAGGRPAVVAVVEIEAFALEEEGADAVLERELD